MTDKEQYIKDLFEDLKYSLSKFDSQSLAISSGALGLALTFIKEIAPFAQSKFILFFYISLGLFIMTLTLGFIGHYLSLRQISKSIEKVERDKISEIKPDKVIPKLNLIIAVSLPLGILFLVLYCVINIESIRNKGEESSKKINIEKENHNGEKISIEGSLNEFKYTDTINKKITIKIK
ncbi:hypothetical protein [Flavobacterium sp. LAR06]|uniref:hypothetical protein n=1 Tax=Flavobacterium sp. LAR06 TaxID=3064897 RepID=UPI0035C09B2D